MKTPLPLPSPVLPNCSYTAPPSLIRPSAPTPAGSLYLSNLDDQHFLRFSIKYLHIFKASVPAETLKQSLSRVLVDYYPLAGRLRRSCHGDGDDRKFEVDCNGEGALFAEASMDLTAEELLGLSRRLNRSWRKLLYMAEGQSFMNAPPLIVQVTNLRCGGMVLCSAICHCLCDGIGTSQFLQAWAHATSKPHAHLAPQPIHSRHALRPRDPLRIPSPHPPQYSPARATGNDGDAPPADLHRRLQSQPLVPVSLTFARSDVLELKRRCVPSVKSTTFEVLAVHTWRSWVRSLGLGPSVEIKLLFSVNIRRRLHPQLQPGFYGNGFVLGCAQTTVSDLCSNLSDGVRLVQQAKSAITDDHVRGVIDLLEDKSVRTDMTTSFVISQWARLGLEDLDFGTGRPIYMGPVTSDVYCLFLPVCGDLESVRVLVSLPENVAKKFECFMRGIEAEECDESAENGFHVGEECVNAKNLT